MDRGPDLVASFRGALPDALRASHPEAELGSTLASLHATATAAWPDFAISPARFAAELGRRLGAHAETVERVAAIEPCDLFLAIACGDGDRTAHQALASRVADELQRCAGRLRAMQHVDDARAIVERILFVTEPGRPAAISTFSGRGNLRAYIRVIASRELVRMLEGQRREVLVDDAAMLDAVLTPIAPELEPLKERYRTEVTEALRAALAALDDRSRALFRYNLIDGWNIERIGAIYGVHRATVARWIAQGREALLELVEKELAARLKIDVDDVGSIVRLVRSKIEVSLVRLLGEPAE